MDTPVIGCERGCERCDVLSLIGRFVERVLEAEEDACRSDVINHYRRRELSGVTAAARRQGQGRYALQHIAGAEAETVQIS